MYHLSYGYNGYNMMIGNVACAEHMMIERRETRGIAKEKKEITMCDSSA